MKKVPNSFQKTKSKPKREYNVLCFHSYFCWVGKFLSQCSHELNNYTIQTELYTEQLLSISTPAINSIYNLIQYDGIAQCKLDFTMRIFMQILFYLPRRHGNNLSFEMQTQSIENL